MISLVSNSLCKYMRLYSVSFLLISLSLLAGCSSRGYLPVMIYTATSNGRQTLPSKTISPTETALPTRTFPVSDIAAPTNQSPTLTLSDSITKTPIDGMVREQCLEIAPDPVPNANIPGTLILYPSVHATDYLLNIKTRQQREFAGDIGLIKSSPDGRWMAYEQILDPSTDSGKLVFETADGGQKVQFPLNITGKRTITVASLAGPEQVAVGRIFRQ